MNVDIKQKIKTLLDSDKFRDWLDTKETGKIVGFPANENSCPLACFLKDNGLIVEVHDNYIQLDEETLDIPEWCEIFISKVDAHGLPVEQWEALSFLDSAESEQDLD